MNARVRRRRRATKINESDYDRTADRFVPVQFMDGSRLVPLDEQELEPTELDLAYYREQQPPHYGH